MRSRIAALSGCLVLVVASLIAMPAVAQAAVHASCSGTWAATFSPPVTQTTNTVTLSYNASYLCPVGPSSATGSYSATISVGCNPSSGVAGVLVTPPEHVSWSNNVGNSTITYTSNTPIGNSATALGSVTAGAFIFANVVKTNTIVGGTTDLAACALGVGSVSALSGTVDTFTLES